MFSRAYRVQKATLNAGQATLQVLPLAGRLPAGPFLAPQSNPAHKLTVQGGRTLKDANGNRLPESLLFIDVPDFDIHTLIDAVLVPAT